MLRQEKLNRLFKKLIAEFIRKEFGAHPLISVIDVALSRDTRKAIVFISVFPSKESAKVVTLLHKKRRDLWEYISRHTKMKYIPNISFKVGEGLELMK